MKVLFLDVDGVLNNDDWCWELFYKYKVQVYRNNILYEPSVLQLKRIVNETGCEIVVSSAWRKVPTAYEDLKNTLKRYGISVIGETPYVGGTRGDDIEAWFKENGNVEAYTILDDDSDMDEHYGHLVQTNYFVGLTKEDADRCIEMLNGKEKTDEN